MIMKEEIVMDAPPPSRWHEKTLSDHINDMKLHRSSVIRRLKQSGVWSKDEIRDVAWIITKRIRALEKLRGVDLHHYDIGKWLCEE